MAESIDFAIHEIPACVPGLAFRICFPRDWKLADLPAAEGEFHSLKEFYPLMVAGGPWMHVFLTVAARPAFESGNLQEWCLSVMDSQEIAALAFGPVAIGNLQGVAAVGEQPQQHGSPGAAGLIVRFAFFEDGGRLVYLRLVAPEGISAPMDLVWQRALQDFTLEEPLGQSVPFGPDIQWGDLNPPSRIPAAALPPESPSPKVEAIQIPDIDDERDEEQQGAVLSASEPVMEGGAIESKPVQRAVELEADDRLEEAEQKIREANPTIGSAMATAEFYRARWIRLRESDPVKAAESRKRAAEWAYTYASWATNGGEGIALSEERDEFLHLLGPEPFE